MPVCSEAAFFSVSRATAPASRSLTKLSGIEVEPPVPWSAISLVTPRTKLRIDSATMPSSVDLNGTPSSAKAWFQ